MLTDCLSWSINYLSLFHCYCIILFSFQERAANSEGMKDEDLQTMYLTASMSNVCFLCMYYTYADHSHEPFWFLLLLITIITVTLLFLLFKSFHSSVPESSPDLKTSPIVQEAQTEEAQEKVIVTRSRCAYITCYRTGSGWITLSLH